METIKHGDAILAIIYRDEDWTEGLNFITPNELFVQVILPMVVMLSAFAVKLREQTFSLYLEFLL